MRRQNEVVVREKGRRNVRGDKSRISRSTGKSSLLVSKGSCY